MAQMLFLILAIGGLAPVTDFIFGSSADPKALLYGRLGILAFSTGVVGLAAIALCSC